MEEPIEEAPLWNIIISLLLNLVVMIFCTVIWRKLFLNLFGCRGCCITFSDRHNWIVAPTKVTRTTAILSVIFYSLAACVAMCFDIFNFFSFETKTFGLFAQILSPALEYLARVLYYFYMISTLESQLKREPLFTKMISRKFLYIMSIVIVSNIILWIVFCVMFIGTAFEHFHDFDMRLFGTIYNFIHALSDIFTDMSLFYLYIRGLSKVNEWWYLKRCAEYKQYGETQKMHEMLIMLTRCSVVCCVTMMTSLLFIIYEFCQYFIVMRVGGAADYIPMFNIIHTLLTNIEIMTYSLAIYVIFDFGYGIYRKICDYCHNKLYEYCQTKHQDHIQKEYTLLEVADIDQSVNS